MSDPVHIVLFGVPAFSDTFTAHKAMVEKGEWAKAMVNNIIYYPNSCSSISMLVRLGWTFYTWRPSTEGEVLTLVGASPQFEGSVITEAGELLQQGYGYDSWTGAVRKFDAEILGPKGYVPLNQWKVATTPVPKVITIPAPPQYTIAQDWLRGQMNAEGRLIDLGEEAMNVTRSLCGGN